MLKCKENRGIIYLIMFAVLFLLCLLFPYSGDDWAWGSQIGLDRLSTWFDNYSGRYFGNLIVLALTRSNVLKAAVMSLCIGGIVVIINEITKRQKCSFGLITVMLVFMPVYLLRQAVVWTAGFSNYVTSIFLTLIYIYYVRDMYEKKPKNSIFAWILTIVLGVANTLIVEHLTIYNVVLSVYVIVFTLIKYKRVYIQHIAYFVGCVLGTCYMFSNSVYSSVASGNDGYRSIGSKTGIVDKAIDSFLNVIVKEGFLNNFVLLSCLTLICLVIWFEIKNKISKKARVIGYISIFINIAYTALSIMHQLSQQFTEAEILIILEGLATIAYVAALIAFVLILPFDFVEKVKLLFILGSAVCMIAPLLVVTPIGSRCFFASYVMFIYFAIELYSNFSEKHKLQFAHLSKAITVVAIIGALYLFYVYGTVCKNHNERVEKAQAEAAAGKKIVEVQELPYKNYVWCSDMYEEVWETRFKLYYGIDEKVKIKMIPHK